MVVEHSQVDVPVAPEVGHRTIVVLGHVAGPILQVAIYLAAMGLTIAAGVVLMLYGSPIAVAQAEMGGLLVVWIVGVGIALASPSVARECLNYFSVKQSSLLTS